MKKIIFSIVTVSVLLLLSGFSGSLPIPLQTGNKTGLLNEYTTPGLNPDSTENDINHVIEITFQKDSAWAVNITEIVINNMVIHFSNYVVYNDKIEILSNVFHSPGTYNIVIRSNGFNDFSLNQVIKEGGIWDNSITGFYPKNNSLKIKKDTSLVITFAKNVVLKEGSIKIFKIEYRTDDGLYETVSSFSENVSGNGTNQITIHPVKGFPIGSYYIMIDDNVFGENFKGFNNSYDWSFSTQSLNVLDQLIPGTVLGHDVRLTISFPEYYSVPDSNNFNGIFILDATWFKTIHQDLHNMYKSGLIPVDPVVITIGSPYDADIEVIRAQDYFHNYDKFYDFMKTTLLPYASEKFRIDPGSRIMAGGSYAGFMTLYSFLRSCIDKDTLYYNYISSSPVLAGYNSLLDKISENTDSIGRNLVFFVAEFDDYSFHTVYKLINDWVEKSDFTYFNFYNEVHMGRTHTTTTYDATKIGIEILLNLPYPYFTMKTYKFFNNDTTSYGLVRKWPVTGILEGDGVSDNRFIPSIAGTGTHTLTYSYTGMNGLTYSREKTVTVSNRSTGIFNDFLSELNIYPNPFTESATITFNESMNVQKIELYNLDGRLIRTYDKIEGNTLKIHRENIPAGVYLLVVQGNKQYMKKLVVQ